MKKSIESSSKEDAIFSFDDLPEGWKLKKLGEVVSPSKEKIEPTLESTIPYIGLEHIESNSSRIIGHGVAGDAKSTKTIFHAGDVLYGKLRPYLNKVAIPDFDGVCSTDILVFNQNQIIDSRYLMRYLSTRDVVEYANLKSKGISLPRVSFESLSEIPVPLPQFSEQQRIIARIEALLAHMNEARERLHRVPLIMKRFRLAALRAGCSGKLTEPWREKNSPESVELALKKIHIEASHTGREATDNIIPGDCILSVGDPETSYPDGWLRVPLQRIARLESGHTPSRKHPDYWDGNVSWIGIEDARLNHGGYINKTLQHVTPLGLENSAARLLPPDTVCLSRTASVGYVVIMKSSMATSQDFVNWVCSEALLPKFLIYALMAEGEGIRKFGRGTTHTTIYYPEVKALHICLPSVEEQLEIVHRIETLFERADQIEQQVVAATKRTGALTQAVLGKAFSGRLV